MRRFVILTSAVWIALIASIAMSFVFWRVGYLRPHAIWAILSIASIAGPMAGLAVAVLWRVIRGPLRWRAIGWLLVGATPLVWIGAYFTHLSILGDTRDPVTLNIPLRLAVTWASSVMDIQARWQYPRWTRGQHAVLMDGGQTPDAARLVKEMDDHIEAMADLLGQSVPDEEFLWVRGSLVGQNGRAVQVWAMCAQEDNPAELTVLDRHENAHTLITALAGPDHEPPFALIEGWAESQSSDRDQQISSLADKRLNGNAYSLPELVSPNWYCRGSGPVYWEGGPLVHYLMEHYGPEKFFELYVGARRSTFDDDCQAILGDSWETVNAEFWAWIESEARLIAAANSDELANTAEPAKIEFAATVNPSDWQALVTGYREANRRDNESLPVDTAFLIELDRVDTDEKSELSKQPSHYEFRAVFAGKEFWAFENFEGKRDHFVMATQERCANLARDESGVLEGWVKEPPGYRDARLRVLDLMRLFRGVEDPAYLLPLRDNLPLPRTWMITELVRPATGSDEPWRISFTSQPEDDDVSSEYQLELDPSLEWSIIRYAAKRPGEWGSISETQYQHVGDLLVPKTISTRFSRGNDEVIAEMRSRPLTDAERDELLQRVERAAREGPTVPYQRLQRFLLAIVVACPLAGVMLLGITRRSVTPQRTT